MVAPIGPATPRLVTDGMVLGLAAGQVVAVAGEGLDEAGGSLGPRTELATLARVEHAGGSSVLYLDAPLVGTYARAGFSVCANLAPASHGETVAEEPMGSTDGTAHQRRVLRRPPLTLVSAPTASGTASTLTVRVGGVAWQEVPSLYQAGRPTGCTRPAPTTTGGRRSPSATACAARGRRPGATT